MSDEKPSHWLRSLILLLVTGGVIAGGWWFWQRQTSKAAAPTAGRARSAALVVTAKVVKDNYSYEVQAIGTVRADETTEISPNVTETVTSLHFDDGDYVEKGALLATLSDAEEQAMLASAKATLAEEEREISRLTALVKSGAAPEARLAERSTQADIARQKILEAEAKLGDRRIVAPFAGWVGLRRISVGALVSPGSVITTLDKVDLVKIDFNVPETVIASLKPGTEIVARAEAAGNKPFKGKLSHLDSRIDPVTRAVAARAEVPNPERLLRPGMLVTVDLAMAPRLSLSIPERALVPVGSRQFVFAIEEGKAKRLPITTDRRKPGFVEVLKGLEEGQIIIADGLVGLQDGAEVKVTGEFKAPVAAFNPEVVK